VEENNRKLVPGNVLRFLASKYLRNALAAGTPPLTELGELKRSPRPTSRISGEERERMGWKSKEGREGHERED